MLLSQYRHITVTLPLYYLSHAVSGLELLRGEAGPRVRVPSLRLLPRLEGQEGVITR